MRFYSFIKKPENTLFIILVFIGCAITIGQFFFNRGFWFDEVLLGLNLVNLNFSGLLEPLRFNQAAPIGYLFIQKIIIHVFGTSEYSFRILSLLGMLVSVPLLYKSVCRLSSSRLIGLLLCSMLCLNFPFVFYANEAKQYAFDVFFTSALFYFTVFIDVKSKKDLLKYGLLGAISVWMSNVAVVSLLVFGLYYLFMSRRTRNYRIILPIVFWIISFITYYLLFINGHPTREFMVVYWERFFLPSNLLDLNTRSSLKYIVKDVLYFTFSVKYTWQYYLHSFFLLLGLGYLVHMRKWRILLLLVSPIMVHAILAMLQLYPLYQRFIIDTLPFIYGIYSYGLFFVWKALKRVGTPLREVIVGIPILTCCLWFTNFPIQREEVRDTFQFVDNAATETDEFYFFKDVTHFYSFYSPRLNNFNELNTTFILPNSRLSKLLRTGEQLNHDAWIFSASWHQPMDKVNLNKNFYKDFEYKIICVIIVNFLFMPFIINYLIFFIIIYINF